jgi:hypothetical protein
MDIRKLKIYFQTKTDFLDDFLPKGSLHSTVMRFLDLKETSTDMAADWIFEKFKLI